MERKPTNSRVLPRSRVTGLAHGGPGRSEQDQAADRASKTQQALLHGVSAHCIRVWGISLANIERLFYFPSLPGSPHLREIPPSQRNPT
jgi:hypothetical protein